jgi:hypothetical protein
MTDFLAVYARTSLFFSQPNVSPFPRHVFRVILFTERFRIELALLQPSAHLSQVAHRQLSAVTLPNVSTNIKRKKLRDMLSARDATFEM